MNYEVLEAIGQIAREKEIDRAVLVETLQAGLVLAAKKRYSDARDVTAVVDLETGDISITMVRKVVEAPANPEQEISQQDARAFKPDAQVGEDVRVPIAVEEFGRAAVQAAKQVIYQRVREARREHVYVEFRDKVGHLVSGSVQHVERGNASVLVNAVEALLPWRHQIRRERHVQGDTVRAVVIEASNAPHGPQVILSRAAPELVSVLFSLEAPEIREGIVRIEAIAREAGVRTKLAVSSREGRVDPVGACVGVKGVRVQAVVRELGGERLDIVPFTADPAVFIARALSPAKIERVVLNEPDKRAMVLVPDDQLSLAIGKGGQNVRLAGRLTGWALDLTTMTQHREQLGAEIVTPIGVVRLPGVGPKIARELEIAGFETVQDVAKAGVEDLMAVPGVGKARGRSIREAAMRLLREAEQGAASPAPDGEPAHADVTREDAPSPATKRRVARRHAPVADIDDEHDARDTEGGV
ncbi:MAG: transcription termination factor NusA [Candidatus Eisenbacteria bacterium]|jgi:N utilization substance protein A|nr:transcription termination factor NusA [Candidatus Eisenbacteria bacterium]